MNSDPSARKRSCGSFANRRVLENMAVLVPIRLGLVVAITLSSTACGVYAPFRARIIEGAASSVEVMPTNRAVVQPGTPLSGVSVTLWWRPSAEGKVQRVTGLVSDNEGMTKAMLYGLAYWAGDTVYFSCEKPGYAGCEGSYRADWWPPEEKTIVVRMVRERQ
jgi:hypothetical protein